MRIIGTGSQVNPGLTLPLINLGFSKEELNKGMK